MMSDLVKGQNTPQFN
jgi:hypothetical protein